MEGKMLHGQITDLILKSFYKVYNTLGYGFLEKVYENAMRIELTQMGISIAQQEEIKVYYNSKPVGDYYADLIANGLVIMELKAAESICEEQEAQLLNYLRATDIEVGVKNLNSEENILQMIKRKICQNPFNPSNQCSIVH
jgi:GxxExxY protein